MTPTLTFWLACYVFVTGMITLTMTATTAPSPDSSSSTTTQASSSTRKSLFCYQCSASSPDEPCVTDTQGMANSSTREIYIKDCIATNPNWTRCMIQTVEIGGKITFYHRDCHDGIFFTTVLNSPRFQNLPANNLTTCDLILEKVVCYRPCGTDFCNGPEEYRMPNETDACKDYESAPYDVIIPPGVTCGAYGVHDRSEEFATRFLGLLMALLIIVCLSVSEGSLLYH